MAHFKNKLLHSILYFSALIHQEEEEDEVKFVWLTQESFGICSLAWSFCIGFVIEFSGLWKIIKIQTLLPSSYCTLMIAQCKWTFIWNDLSRHSIDSSFRMFSNISKFTKINLCSNFCHACFSMVIQSPTFHPLSMPPSTSTLEIKLITHKPLKCQC